jgi:acyl-coenzyme A thioesterase PaaI-like protein
MNDEPATGAATSFDPAAHGWRAIVNHTAFGDLVGPIWRIEENGKPRFGFIVAPKHLNRAGNLHGGMLMTLADQSMAMTARTQFVGGVRLGEFVEAHPEVVRATRSVVFMQVRMFVGERIVLSANGIWKILEEA